MKVDKKFVEVYNETFKFIRKIGGIECLISYFRKIAPIILGDLDEAVNKEGLIGAFKYWKKVLTLEGCGYDLKMNSAEDSRFGKDLKLDINQCSSKNHLVDPSPDYCRHCSIMYKELFTKYGYDFELINRGPASCTITIKDSITKDSIPTEEKE